MTANESDPTHMPETETAEQLTLTIRKLDSQARERTADGKPAYTKTMKTKRATALKTLHQNNEHPQPCELCETGEYDIVGDEA